MVPSQFCPRFPLDFRPLVLPLNSWKRVRNQKKNKTKETRYENPVKRKFTVGRRRARIEVDVRRRELVEGGASRHVLALRRQRRRAQHFASGHAPATPPAPPPAAAVSEAASGAFLQRPKNPGESMEWKSKALRWIGFVITDLPLISP